MCYYDERMHSYGSCDVVFEEEPDTVSGLANEKPYKDTHPGVLDQS